MKPATPDKLQITARGSQCHLFYLARRAFAHHRPFSAAGHHASCPIPSSPTIIVDAASLPHFADSLVYAASACTVKGPDIVGFLDTLIRQCDGQPTVIVLDNASIHHRIGQATLDPWLINHKALLFYLPPYRPERNLIVIVWKQFNYYWRRFITWTKETIDVELANPLDRYGTQFQVNFS